MEDNPFLLCQPDEKKGCSACCGLFNLSDLSRVYLDKFLSEGSFRRDNGWRYTQEECYIEQTTEVRDRATHICAFQGFLSDGKPGCLIHPLARGIDERSQSLFGSKVCGNFLCPAYKILTDDEKKILIDNIDDWYLYTVAIIDPVTTRWILNTLDEFTVDKKGDGFRQVLAECLALHAGHLSRHRGSVFCYSIPEYNLESKHFSLAAEGCENAESVRAEIEKLIAEKNC